MSESIRVTTDDLDDDDVRERRDELGLDSDNDGGTP